MLKYLVILLDDTSTSYCHFTNNKDVPSPMPIDILKAGILFAMKNDLKIQYVLPKYKLPNEYIDLMRTMYHNNIGPLEMEHISDVVVVERIDDLVGLCPTPSKRYIVRTTVNEFINKYTLLGDILISNISINIVFVDVENFTNDNIEIYRDILSKLCCTIETQLINGVNINTNLITDIIALQEMNSCGAGDTSITLVPNGDMYPCPAFYYDNNFYYKIGNIKGIIEIKDKKLYTLNGAPLCKSCDAFHCKRCVWLNKKLTCEVNIPSRQQCVMSHIEREAGKNLLARLHARGILLNRKIKDIDYLDPFDKYNKL